MCAAFSFAAYRVKILKILKIAEQVVSLLTPK